MKDDIILPISSKNGVNMTADRGKWNRIIEYYLGNSRGFARVITILSFVSLILIGSAVTA